MRQAFKFNIIKFPSWTCSTDTLCVRTTEITLKGFITQIANRAHNRSNVVLRSKHHCLFRREFLEGRLQLSPSWRVLRGAAGHILQEFHKLDNVQSGAEGWVCHNVWIFWGERSCVAILSENFSPTCLLACLGQIYFIILTNIFWSLDKYILKFGHNVWIFRREKLRCHSQWGFLTHLLAC